MRYEVPRARVSAPHEPRQPLSLAWSGQQGGVYPSKKDFGGREQPTIVGYGVANGAPRVGEEARDVDRLCTGICAWVRPRTK